MIDQNNRKTIGKVISAISFSSYEILHDKFQGGYKVKLNWQHRPGALFYKIYKAVLPQSNLNKTFNVTQKTLEKVSAGSSFNNAKTNILYNKNMFIKSNQVNLDNSSNRFLDNVQDYQFSEVSQILTEKDRAEYFYFDKNVKFGKGYSYVVTFTNESLQESPKILPITINVQELKHPEKPSILQSFTSPDGLALLIGNKLDGSICFYDIYRQNKETSSESKFIARIETQDGMASYVDRDVISGNEYTYKVFSVDFYENLSLESATITKGLNQLFVNDATIPFPEVEMINNHGNVEFKIKKNHEKLIGATIQRKDVWKHEPSFLAKSYSNFIWPQISLFENNVATFKDIFLENDQRYQYRIVTVLKNLHPGAYWFSPIFTLQDLKDTMFVSGENINEKFKLNKFSLEMVDSKQSPIFVKFNIDTSGKWSHLTVKYNDNEIKIDALHKSFFLQFEKKQKLILKLTFFDNDKALNSIESLKVNT